MKLITLAVFVLLQMSALAELDMPGSWTSALPLQAAVSDLVGIGRAVALDATNAVVQVDQLWYGSATNNVVNISNQDQHSFPTNGAPFVFFASRYSSFLELEPPECHFAYIFDMDYHRSRHQPDGVFLYCGDRSWFPVTSESAQMVNWCSNLVYVSQVTTNRQAFYELIRDGYRLNPESSRMHRDSEYAFQYFHYYMSTNFMQQVWSDTNLVGKARVWIRNRYWLETKTGLP